VVLPALLPFFISTLAFQQYWCLYTTAIIMDEKPTMHRLSHASDSPDSKSIHRERKASITSFGHGKSKAEKKILRKMDLRLIPMLALLYLLSFLDRGNIGNAKIEGLTEDLNMTGAQYNWYAFCNPVAFFPSMII
jgi:hypothetical protein